ncbi:MAG: SCO family protein [Deltaproteobacteria bacterium]|nr:SCO family protein [Deltaproteobacteria bacterium]
MAFYQIFLLLVFLAPAAPTGLGAFAEDFRVWCYGYDPATGHYQIAYILSMFTPPWMLAGFIFLFWWAPLKEIGKQPAKLASYVATSGVMVSIVGGGMLYLGLDSELSTNEMPFPAEVLRTAHTAPTFNLTNQDGQAVDLESLRGNVVILTSVYASCPHTCPAVLAQAKAAIAELPEELRSDLHVVAISMDPANDTPEVLSELADMHDMQSPLYQFATGDPVVVNKLLNRMEIARTRDEETGIINHANLFMLIDRTGQVAYRLTLGPRQQRWLVSALTLLLKEHDPNAVAKAVE